jgi:hypothetical protein
MKYLGIFILGILVAYTACMLIRGCPKAISFVTQIDDETALYSYTEKCKAPVYFTKENIIDTEYTEE